MKLTAYLRASRAAEIIRSLVTLKGAQGASPMRNMLYLHPQTLALSKLLAFSKQCREYQSADPQSAHLYQPYLDNSYPGKKI